MLTASHRVSGAFEAPTKRMVKDQDEGHRAVASHHVRYDRPVETVSVVYLHMHKRDGAVC